VTIKAPPFILHMSDNNTLKAGDLVTFHGSLHQDIPAQEGTFTVKHYMPGGSRAEDVFNQPMVVLEDTDFGWVPAYCVKHEQ
jgi:hypothetical protein